MPQINYSYVCEIGDSFCFAVTERLEKQNDLILDFHNDLFDFFFGLGFLLFFLFVFVMALKFVNNFLK